MSSGGGVGNFFESAGKKIGNKVGDISQNVGNSTLNAGSRLNNVAANNTSAVYHVATLDLSQAGKDVGNTLVDSGVVNPGGEIDPGPSALDLTPIAVDPNALALRRQRMLASAYGRGQTILSNPSTSLGASSGGTSLGL